MFIGIATEENSMELPQKTKNRMPYDPAVLLLDMHIPMQNYNLKRYMYPYRLPW